MVTFSPSFADSLFSVAIFSERRIRKTPARVGRHLGPLGCLHDTRRQATTSFRRLWKFQGVILRMGIYTKKTIEIGIDVVSLVVSDMSGGMGSVVLT